MDAVEFALALAAMENCEREECLLPSEPMSMSSASASSNQEWHDDQSADVRSKLALSIALNFLLNKNVSLIRMGLTVEDVAAKLELVSKDVRARCVENCCWEEAAQAMDSDFAFPEDFQEALQGDRVYLPLFHWRTRSDPRCSVEFTHLPPKERFVRLLLFGQFVIKTLTVWCMEHVDRTWWGSPAIWQMSESELVDIIEPITERREGETETSWHNSCVLYARAMKELHTRHGKRCDLLLKIAFAMTCENGFFPHSTWGEPYLNDDIEHVLQSLVDRRQASTPSSFLRETINEDLLIPDLQVEKRNGKMVAISPRVPPGSDEHICENNCDQDVIPRSKALLGARLVRTLRLLPFDDLTMSKLLEDYPMNDTSPASQTPRYTVDWSPLPSHPDYSLGGFGWRTGEEVDAGMEALLSDMSDDEDESVSE